MILPFTPPVFRIEIPAPHTVITLDTPSKGDFYALLTGADAAAILSHYTDVPLTPAIARAAADEYVRQLTAYREKNMDYMEIPQVTDFADTGTSEEKLPCLTAAEHMVYEYTGMDFAAQLGIPVTEYWTLLADAVKFRIMRREDADEYLEQCWKDMHKISDF